MVVTLLSANTGGSGLDVTGYVTALFTYVDTVIDPDKIQVLNYKLKLQEAIKTEQNQKHIFLGGVSYTVVTLVLQTELPAG